MTGEINELARHIAATVADQLSREREDQASQDGFSATDERVYVRKLIAGELEAEARRRLRSGVSALGTNDEDEVAREAYARLYGLGRLQRYLDDPRITDIHVQGHDVVWLKHADGTRHPGGPIADNDQELVELLRTAAARLGRTERRFDAATPELNLQLPDGSRLFAVMEVAARPSVTIRKHQFDLASLTDLRDRGGFGEPIERFLRAAVLARKSIVIGGGIGCGKTTMMRALINEIPSSERLVTVEDALELGTDRFPDLHPNAVSLEAREPNIEGHGGIPMEQLVRMGLRMDPDRVFVGEVRGAEVLPMLLAMSQGRDGSMCTIHANTARGVFRRLQMYAALPPHRLPPDDTAMLIANAVDFVVHLDRRESRDGQVERYVTSILEVRDVSGSDVVANEVFRPGPDGRAQPSGMLHEETLADLAEAGFSPRLLVADAEVPSWS